MIELPSLRIGEFITEIPVIQGGMGVGISLSGLAAAVANEGGIGVIASAMIGMGERDRAKSPIEADCRALIREIREARNLTDGILGVNIMVAITNFAEMVQTSIEEKIDVIFAGAGLPFDLPKYLTETSRSKLVPIVSSGRAAKLICQRWLSRYDYLPDAFVVEGPMAGGHLGLKKEQIDHPDYLLENLVEDVIESVKPFEEERQTNIPIIAAGGVFTGADIHKFLQLGASGVQMGTRFVGTHECDAEDGFKQAYLDAKEEDIVIIESPVGLPGRAIKNSFLVDVERGQKMPFSCPYHCITTCDYKETPYCIALALVNAKKGRLKNGFVFAGKNAYRINEIVSVKDVITSLKDEYRQCVSSDDDATNGPIAANQ